MKLRRASDRRTESAKDIGEVIIAFLIPVILIVSIFLLLRIYPFGSRNIINNDLYHQYLPVMTEFRRAIENGEGILYTFRGGLGTNFYSLSTYQNFSPVTCLFLFIFDLNHIALAVTLMIIFKIGLSGSAMYYYLKHSDESASSDKMLLMSLSAMYSLSGYVIAYYYNFMWLDAVLLLPLVILGMRRLIDKGGSKLHVTALSVMIISNYYIGLITCIFIALYFFVYHLSERKEHLLKNALRVGLFSAASLLISMFVLLPTIISLTKTNDFLTLTQSGSSRLFYHSIFAHIAQLFPNSKVTVTFGPANIYSGLISVIASVFYALNKNIDKKKRIIKLAFVLMIFFSTNFVPLDLAWHLFHIPNGIPARYSFVLTFMLIEITWESLDNLEYLNRKIIRLTFGIICAAYIQILAGNRSLTFAIPYFVITAAIFISLYFMFFNYACTGNNTGYKYLSMIIIFEIFFAGLRSFAVSGLVEGENYFSHREDIDNLIETAEQHNPFSRMEITDSDNFNAPFVYGYNGLSLFASSASHDTYTALSRLMYDRKPGINMFHYGEPSVIADTLFNIRNYISVDKQADYPWMSEKAEANGCHLYENKYHGAPGFMVKVDSLPMDFGKSQKEILNKFIEENTGVRDVMGDDGADLAKWEAAYDRLFDQVLVIDGIQGNKVRAHIDVREGGILMTSIPYDESWQISVDGSSLNDFGSLKYFISFPMEKGEHEIEMTYIPRGLYPGIIISISALIIYIIYEYGKCRRMKGSDVL